MSESKAAEQGEYPVRQYSVSVCDQCIRLEGQMCHNPYCVFCRRTMEEVRECLNVTLIRPLVDGKPIFTPEETINTAESGAPVQQGVTKPKRMSRKEHRQARRREKRAILAQMPYRTAEEWADGMVQIKEVPLERGNRWQLVFCGYHFPAHPDKGTVENHAANLKRVFRKKLRYYAAQEKRALCAVFAQRQKEGRDIFKPELAAPAPPVSEGLKHDAEIALRALIRESEYNRTGKVPGDSQIEVDFKWWMTHGVAIEKQRTKAEIESHGVTFLNPPLSEEEAQRAKELKASTKAGPSCPKCGSSKVDLAISVESGRDQMYAGCYSGTCDFQPVKVSSIADFAQFFPLPSPEQGWVKEAAEIVFSTRDWYCWCETCCLLRRVLTAPPRPSTEEGK